MKMEVKIFAKFIKQVFNYINMIEKNTTLALEHILENGVMK